MQEMGPGPSFAEWPLVDETDNLLKKSMDDEHNA
jgi:hypothetical protein